MKKRDLPAKLCLTCGRPFKWRKKWERDWDNVKYCSEKCKRNKVNETNMNFLHSKFTDKND